jgi:DeoR/GlpR family transcriptional regulator of sugar metabolism
VLILERQRLILEHVRRKGLVSVRDEAKVLGTQERTVRRDLVALAGNGLVRRTRGGAVLPQGFKRESTNRNQTPAPEDVVIAMAAAELIRPADSIVLGAGGPTLALARELIAVPDLTVITNSLLICEALVDAPGVDLFLTGGSLRRSTMALVGPSAEHSLRGLRASMAFLSGDGLTALHGLSTSNLSVADADRAVAAAARRVVALVPHGRVGRDHLCQIVPCSSLQMVITGAGADIDEVQLIRELGVEVRAAPGG